MDSFSSVFFPFSLVVRLSFPIVLLFSFVVPPSSPLVLFFSPMILPPSLVVPPFSLVVSCPRLVLFSPLVPYTPMVFSFLKPNAFLIPYLPITFPSWQLVRTISLPPNDNLLQNDLSKEIFKEKRDNVKKLDSANMMKLRFLLMASSKEEETVQLTFGYCKCSSTIKIKSD